jgi:hypothetical protein
MYPVSKKWLTALLGVALLGFLTACSVHEQREEGGNNKVDIKTPFAEIHVGTDTDAKDTGIAPYPGATPKEGTDSDKHRANVSIGGENFGVHVVTASFVTNDPPDKVIDFYRKDLKRYGTVLECPKGISENKHADGGEIRCSESGSSEPGKMDLAVGVPDHQHLVAVKPHGKGTEFSLVYVNVSGKKETM